MPATEIFPQIQIVPRMEFQRIGLRHNFHTSGAPLMVCAPFASDSSIIPGPLLRGTGYTAALFGGPRGITDENDPNLILAAVTTFRTQVGLEGTFVAIPFTGLGLLAAGGLYLSRRKRRQ